MLATMNPKATNALTPAQREVYEMVVAYRAQHGVSPTLQELADKLGVSKVTVWERIEALKKKGWIHADKHLSRSIRPAVEKLPADEALRAGVADLVGRLETLLRLANDGTPGTIRMAESILADARKLLKAGGKS